MHGKQNFVRSPRIISNNRPALSLGQVIQKHREKMGISLRELARRIGMSPSMLSLVERDRVFASPVFLAKMAKVFGLPVQELEKLDTRLPFNKLKRLVERSPELTAALRFVLTEVQSGRKKPEEFASALLSIRNSRDRANPA